jgi:hypothetical protein
LITKNFQAILEALTVLVLDISKAPNNVDASISTQLAAKFSVNHDALKLKKNNVVAVNQIHLLGKLCVGKKNPNHHY